MKTKGDFVMEVILRTKDLTKKYDNRIVVDNLNLEIRKGEIFGLLGPNGAGKSTTMNMICNIVRPTLGSVEFLGKDMKKNSRELLRRLGFIPQDLAIHNKLKAWELKYNHRELGPIQTNAIEIDKIMKGE
jgi:ABC-2 type transport system ATP-binding protein